MCSILSAEFYYSSWGSVRVDKVRGKLGWVCSILSAEFYYSSWGSVRVDRGGNWTGCAAFCLLSFIIAPGALSGLVEGETGLGVEHSVW